MGNSIKYKNSNDLNNKINVIAANLILSQSLKDIIKTTNINDYEQLLKLIYKIINNSFNNENILLLSKQINIKTNKNHNELSIEISKYYVKILNLFNFIIMNLNNNLKDKPNNEMIINTEMNNLCYNKLSSILYNNNLINNINDCNNMNDDKKHIYDNFVFNDLEKLYFDVFDYEKGEFNNMTDYMKNIYKNDLNNFYCIVNNKKSNTEIKSFKDISLLNLKNTCNNGELFNEIYSQNNKNKLFSKYIENIHNIKKNIKYNQKKLIDIIDYIFIIKDCKIFINNNLNINKLDDFIIQTKDIIINIYDNCEKYYNRSILIYDAIIDNINLDVNQKRIDNIKNNIELLNSNSNINI